MAEERSQLKAGVVLNYLNLALSSLVPIFYTPIMLRLMGQEEYGLYKLSASLTSYLGLLSMGLGAAITRYLIKARMEKGKEEEEKILGLFVAIFSIISVVVLVVGVILSLNLGRWYSDSLQPDQLSRMRILVVLMTCNTAVSLHLSPLLSAINSHERFIFQQSFAIFLTLFLPAVNLIALFMGYASIGLAVTSLGVQIFSMLGYAWYVHRSLHLKPRFARMPKSLLKEIFFFSFWVFVAQIAGLLGASTDTVMIGSIPVLASAGVAIYNVGAIFSNIIGSLNTGISSVLVPRANKMVFSGAANEQLTDMVILTARIQCLLISLFVFGFVAFGRPFISLYAGLDYIESYWVAILIMLPLMIPLLQSLCLSILMARNKNRFRALTYLFIAVINVIGTWFLLHIWGVKGAALMTGLSYLIGHGLIMNWYYWKRMGLNIPRFWKSIVGIFVIPILLTVLTLWISTKVDFYNICPLLIGMVVYAVAYCILSWLFVMNDYEKGLVRKPIETIKSKFKR